MKRFLLILGKSTPISNQMFGIILNFKNYNFNMTIGKSIDKNDIENFFNKSEEIK